MIDEIIELDSELGIKLGFISVLYHGYLWIKGNDIYISALISKHENEKNLNKLFDRIESLGYGIKIPTPLGKMKSILQNKGFKKIIEHDPNIGNVDIWIKNN